MHLELGFVQSIPLWSLKMKISVWTKHGITPPKCIFQGNMDAIPREGEYIVVREGFCAHTVTSVCYSAVKNGVEITIDEADDKNEYGPCIFNLD